MDPVMDDTTSTINELNYMRPIGAYKPHFAGVPDTYYPLTCSETLRGVLILFFTIGGVLGIMVGFLFWIILHGLELYVIIWVAILLFFMTASIIAFYCGGKARRKM